MSRIISLFLLILFLIIPSVSAQVLPDSININIFPSEPKPGEQVTAMVESFDIDLSFSTITWKYNNTILASGLGKTTVSFTAPSASNTAVLSVTASSSNGTIQTNTIIRSASVDMIWEATDSYTPPFYKGKALPSVGARIKVAAIPSITAPKSLSYKWQYNGDAITNQSGTNKNSLSIKTDVLSSAENFSVAINNGGFSGTGNINVSLRDPNVVIYQKSNGFIDYANGSLRDVYIDLPGVTLRAEPFNFSFTNSLDQSLSIGFKLSDQSYIGNNSIQELSITRPDQGGQSSFSTTVTSIRERLQQISKSFVLHF
ncbi:MAG: hypothetical protein KBC11_03185 [Candidatus Pacebacteria bacterium]|jgi:hypothetical protein|nr:hypothetical protein [Candidatus Paceibacterota bacterium]